MRILLICFLALGISALPTDLTTRKDDELDAKWNYRPESNPLGPPLQLTVKLLDDDAAFVRVEVSWQPPKRYDDVMGQKSIQEYILYYCEATASNWKEIKIPGAMTSTPISGLRRNTLYHFRIRARPAYTEGTLSDAVFYRTEGDDKNSEENIYLQGPPRGLTVRSEGEVLMSAKLEVSWKPPNGFDNAMEDRMIEEYILYFREATSPKWTEAMIRGDITSVSITGLKKNTVYRFQIRANTNSVEGPLSDVVPCETEGDEEISGVNADISGGSADDEETEDAFDNEAGDQEENNEIPTPPAYQDYYDHEDDFHGIW